MPIDAVWILATVPQKSFEQSLLTALHSKDGTNEHNNKPEKLPEGMQYMETILAEALEHLNIHDAVWVPSRNGLYYHVYFTSDMDSNDHAMYYLRKKGVGSGRRSTLGYVPFSLFYFNEDGTPDLVKNGGDAVDYSQDYFKEIQQSFLKSVTSRLTVSQIVEGVKAGSLVTFDFYMYTLLSCMIAAMGIMNDSPVDIAASMMIEPLMGCVMAVSFGLAMRSRDLITTGLKGLAVGMMVCLVFGYIYGLAFMNWRSAWNPPPEGVWPTAEMQSRGQYRTLIYGIFIAVAGGAVLAVIMLKNNIVALTGVAVATTFMPPFVNGGLCLALATHLQIASLNEDYQQFNLTNLGGQFNLKPSWVPPEKYQTQYVADMRKELLCLAMISLVYTFVNVFFLLASSYLVLKIKEIAPIKHFLPSEQKFFSEDIKIYREYQRKFGNTAIEGPTTGKQILEEWASISGVNPSKLFGAGDPDAKATREQTLEDIINDVEADENYQSITRNAFGSKYQPSLHQSLTQNVSQNNTSSQYNNLSSIFTTLNPSALLVSNDAKERTVEPPKNRLPLGYATLRHHNRNRIRKSSLWPSSSVNSESNNSVMQNQRIAQANARNRTISQIME